MNIGEIGYLISKCIVYLFVAVTSIYGSYSLYYAYCKLKDEREKDIVLRSTAKAFSIALILFIVYYIIQISVKVANVYELTLLWDLLHFTTKEVGFTAGTAASTMMGLLGICLFFDKRKAGKV